MKAVSPVLPSSTVPPSQADFKLWTPDQRLASMREALRHWQDGDDVWVFGYGSLIWRPEFEYVERRLATLHGHHRALCLWSRVNRGTPETPGLVFGLDRGGSCRGMVYRMAGAGVSDFFPKLWEREMSTGAYLPRWLRCTTDEGDVSALVFIMNRENPAYISALPREELLAVVKRATGRYGACTEYVLETHRALMDAGICDRQLASVAADLTGQDYAPGED